MQMRRKKHRRSSGEDAVCPVCGPGCPTDCVNPCWLENTEPQRKLEDTRLKEKGAVLFFVVVAAVLQV